MMKFNYTVIIYDKDMKVLHRDISYPIIEELRIKSESAYYALSITGFYNQQTDWITMQDEMLDFSLLYPDYIFLIQEGYLWRYYFSNGKSCVIKGRVIFEDFNTDDLI